MITCLFLIILIHIAIFVLYIKIFYKVIGINKQIIKSESKEKFIFPIKPIINMFLSIFIAWVFVDNFEKINIYVAISFVALDGIMLFMQLDKLREISVFEAIVKTIEESTTKEKGGTE